MRSVQSAVVFELRRAERLAPAPRGHVTCLVTSVMSSTDGGLLAATCGSRPVVLSMPTGPPTYAPVLIPDSRGLYGYAHLDDGVDRGNTLDREQDHQVTPSGRWIGPLRPRRRR